MGEAREEGDEEEGDYSRLGRNNNNHELMDDDEVCGREGIKVLCVLCCF